jgi:hypothetical protein
MLLDLTDEEEAALLTESNQIIDNDRQTPAASLAPEDAARHNRGAPRDVPWKGKKEWPTSR